MESKGRPDQLLESRPPQYLTPPAASVAPAADVAGGCHDDDGGAGEGIVFAALTSAHVLQTQHALQRHPHHHHQVLLQQQESRAEYRLPQQPPPDVPQHLAQPQMTVQQHGHDVPPYGRFAGPLHDHHHGHLQLVQDAGSVKSGCLRTEPAAALGIVRHHPYDLQPQWSQQEQQGESARQGIPEAAAISTNLLGQRSNPEEVAATNSGPSQDDDASSEEMSSLVNQIRRTEPSVLWRLVRSRVLPQLTPWTYLCEKAKHHTQVSKLNGDAVVAVKLRYLIQEMNVLAEELSRLVDNCCEWIEDEDDDDEDPESLESAEISPVGKEPPEAGRDRLDLGAEDNNKENKKVEGNNEDAFEVEIGPMVRAMLGCDKRLRPKDLHKIAPEYQGLFRDQDVPPAVLSHIKLELADNVKEDGSGRCHPGSLQGHEGPSSSECTAAKPPKASKDKRKGPPYRCPVCTRVFANRNRFNYHQKKEGACPGLPVEPKPHRYVGNRYYCVHEDCLPRGTQLNVETHPQYTNRTQYWKHFMDSHGSSCEFKFSCSQCAETFPLKEMVDYHVKSKHQRSHTCGYCGARFPERRTLIKHVRCHTGEKPYACDSCDFRCSSSSSLCQHKRRRHDPTESGRKHICDQCGKGFYTRDNLKEHLATHSNAKMFSCYICGKGLKNDSCYRRHMVCVHGLKHTCNLCGKDFSSPVGLKHHQRGVHGIMF